MEKLTNKYENLKKSLAAFARSVELYKKPHSNASIGEQEAYVASLIKHFELFLESFWKFFKVYLFEQFGTDVSGSKTIFKTCLTHKLIQENELEMLLAIIDERNVTTHVYDEKTARLICNKIIDYYPAMKTIVDRSKPVL